MTNIRSFCRIHNITAEVTETGENPNMADFDGRHYRVTLKRRGKQMTVPYPREKEKKEKRLINLGEVIAEIAATIKERKEEGVHYQ